MNTPQKNKKLIFIGLLVVVILAITVLVTNTKLFTRSKASTPAKSVQLSDVIQVKDAAGNEIVCNLDANQKEYTCETNGDSFNLRLAIGRMGPW